MLNIKRLFPKIFVGSILIISSITVPASTLKFLPEGAQAILEAKGLIAEK